MSLLDAAAGTANASLPLPWLMTSGQPGEPQFRALHNAGVSTVIDIRDAMEPRPFDEPATARALDLHYVNIPIVAGALDDPSMTRVLDALRAARPARTLLHCNSANRTGGPLIAYLMIDEGMPEDRAVDMAMRAGLRSAELLEWGVDYARRTMAASQDS